MNDEKKDTAANETGEKKISVFKVLFLISLLYYAVWIVIAVVSMFVGVNTDWAAPALSDGELDYGFEAFEGMLEIGVLKTLFYFWFIPLYQICYLIGKFFRWLSKKCREADEPEK